MYYSLSVANDRIHPPTSQPEAAGVTENKTCDTNKHRALAPVLRQSRSIVTNQDAAAPAAAAIAAAACVAHENCIYSCTQYVARFAFAPHVELMKRLRAP